MQHLLYERRHLAILEAHKSITSLHMQTCHCALTRGNYILKHNWARVGSSVSQPASDFCLTWQVLQVSFLSPVYHQSSNDLA